MSIKKAFCEACHLQLMKTEENLTELKAGVLSASQEVYNICDQLKLLETKISEMKKGFNNVEGVTVSKEKKSVIFSTTKNYESRRRRLDQDAARRFVVSALWNPGDPKLKTEFHPSNSKDSSYKQDG